MNPIEQVYELFQDKSKWTKGAFARDAEGVRVESDAPDAVCWCLIGGFNKCGVGCAEREPVRLIAQRLYQESSLAHLNDRLGYDAVMKVLKTVIEEEIEECPEQN